MSRAGLAMVVLAAFHAAGAQAQDFSEIKLEELAKDFIFTEGPAWSQTPPATVS